jgi:hypothetical protein
VGNVSDTMPGTARLATALGDRYRLERELGAGGMATVYVARDLKHQREVALKVLRPELAAVLGAERFLHEIRITAQLDHPHILTLIDSGEIDGFLYYVLPLVRGESLRTTLEREKQLGLVEALAITQQIAGALEYAHRKGVVHRDIKPENILLHEGEAMLADFGIALAVKEAGGNRLTETGLSLGTPQYMSPEQATGDRQLDARSDIYSLGAVLYEMLAGEPPVTGATAQAMIAKLMTERPTRLRVVRDTVPEGIDNAVARALAKVPADRFKSAAEFVAALSAPSVGSARAGGTRRRWWLVATVVGAVAVAVVAALLVPRPPSTPAVTLQLTSTGAAFAPSLSPDGTLISYVVETCDQQRRCRQSVLVQDLGSGSRPTVVADGFLVTLGGRWSSDGTRLYLAGIRDTAFATYSVPRFGGTMERIGPYWGVAVHPNGQKALSAHPAGPVLVLRGGTWEVQDTIRLPGVTALGVEWAPNGRWAMVMGFSRTTATLVLLDAEGRVVDQVTEPRLGTGGTPTRGWQGIRWTPESDGVYFMAEAPGSRADLLRRDVDPRRGRFVGGGDTVLAQLQVPWWSSFDVSADGRMFTYSGGLTTYELWTIERTRPGRSWSRRHLLTSTTGLTNADLSDDGRQIVYGAVEGSGDSVWQRVYVQPFDGTEPHAVGPRLHGEIVEGPWFPHGLGDTLFIRFLDHRDSSVSALIPVRGGPMVSLPRDVSDIVGLPNGHRLWFRARVDTTTLEWHDRGGAIERSWTPDTLGYVMPRGWPSADGHVIALLGGTIQDGTMTVHLYRLDTESGEISLLSDHVPGSGGWGGFFIKWLADGRLAVDSASSLLSGTENLRLRIFPARTASAAVEELPLPFRARQFDATADLRRGVGIVESRRSDVFLVRNFDPRNRR